MRAKLLFKCGQGHKWEQKVEVERTGIEHDRACECGLNVRAEFVNLPDVIRHCPDCGAKYAYYEAKVC